MNENLGTIEPKLSQQLQEITRPIYVRHVPEPVWNLIHENAIKSRLRLSAYLVKLMEQARPFPPQPLTRRSQATFNEQPATAR